jgi:hypothetical protein
MAKRLASSLMRLAKRLGQRHVNEKTAKVFVKEIDFFQPEDEGPEGGRDLCRPANQLTTRTHAAA